MSSETSTDRRADAPAGFQPAHFYLIASMVAATAAVMVSRNTHPVALLLLSAMALAAGFVGFMLHRSVAGFFGLDGGAPAPSSRAVETLEREKALVLRSIKELEFDHAMGKISTTDFEEIRGRLRARALALMQDLERAAKAPATTPKREAGTKTIVCGACGTANDRDARFCKQCGGKL